jgi:hypothetical protein
MKAEHADHEIGAACGERQPFLIGYQAQPIVIRSARRLRAPGGATGADPGAHLRQLAEDARGGRGPAAEFDRQRKMPIDVANSLGHPGGDLAKQKIVLGQTRRRARLVPAHRTAIEHLLRGRHPQPYAMRLTSG